MNIEKKQKKDYAAPEMIEVELVHMSTLMCESGFDDDGTPCGDGLFQ